MPLVATQGHENHDAGNSGQPSDVKGKDSDVAGMAQHAIGSSSAFREGSAGIDTTPKSVRFSYPPCALTEKA
jgi:hypothetical protein